MCAWTSATTKQPCTSSSSPLSKVVGLVDGHLAIHTHQEQEDIGSTPAISSIKWLLLSRSVGTMNNIRTDWRLTALVNKLVPYD